MRLWSIHPQYLDPTGLVALWREALLAQAVLSGFTRGYKNHPQLFRFQVHPDPLLAIGAYLKEIQLAATARGYSFNATKIRYTPHSVSLILVTSGQIYYEFSHLKQKLLRRNPKQLARLALIQEPESHPLFQIQPGDIEHWERIKCH